MSNVVSSFNRLMESINGLEKALKEFKKPISNLEEEKKIRSDEAKAEELKQEN